MRLLKMNIFLKYILPGIVTGLLFFISYLGFSHGSSAGFELGLGLLIMGIAFPVWYKNQ